MPGPPPAVFKACLSVWSAVPHSNRRPHTFVTRQVTQPLSTDTDLSLYQPSDLHPNIMSASIKKGLTWALTTLQISPEKKKSNNAVLSPLKTCLNSRPELSSDSGDKENAQPTFSRSEIADHCSGESCWMVINNKVYDVTRFLRMHPGGEDIMLEYGGHDATSAFIDKGHSGDAYDMLSEYCIGRVVKADWFPEKNFT